MKQTSHQGGEVMTPQLSAFQTSKVFCCFTYTHYWFRVWLLGLLVTIRLCRYTYFSLIMPNIFWKKRLKSPGKYILCLIKYQVRKWRGSKSWHLSFSISAKNWCPVEAFGSEYLAVWLCGTQVRIKIFWDLCVVITVRVYELQCSLGSSSTSFSWWYKTSCLSV